MRENKNVRVVIKYLTIIIGLIILLHGTLNAYSQTKLAALYILIISAELIIFSRKNTLLTLLFISLAYFNYSIAFSNYLHIINGTIFTRLANTSTANVAIYILLLFWITILAFFKINVEELNLLDKDILVCNSSSKNSKLMVYGLYIVLLLVFIFGFKSPEIRGERGSVSTIYEYSTIIFILCYYFGNKYKDCKIITTLLLSAFALQNLIYGGRATALQLLLILYIFVFSYRYSIKKILPLGLLGITVLTVVGGARGNIIYGNFDVASILSNFKNHLFTLDTAYSSYFTSLTFIKARTLVTFSTRMVFFFHLFISIFLGGRYLGEYNLPIFTRKYFVHYYGGVLPYYFYFYFWWFGIIIIGMYVAYFISKCNKKDFNNSNGLNKCICTYFIATSPRWFLYSSTPLTRGMLLLIITYFIANFISKTNSRIKSIDK